MVIEKSNLKDVLEGSARHVPHMYGAYSNQVLNVTFPTNQVFENLMFARTASIYPAFTAIAFTLLKAVKREKYRDKKKTPAF